MRMRVLRTVVPINLASLWDHWTLSSKSNCNCAGALMDKRDFYYFLPREVELVGY